MFRYYLHLCEFALSAHLFRHGLRRATFPRGEGFVCRININLNLYCIYRHLYDILNLVEFALPHDYL